MIEWQWSKFSNLSLNEFYQIATARQDVFINEQQCFYTDLDGLDQFAWHLVAWDSEPPLSERPAIKKLVAYLRVIYPNILYNEPSVGRLLTIKQERSNGLANNLLKRALNNINEAYPDTAVRLSAQLYLQDFYEGYGFNATSKPYKEDGIDHIDMLKP